MEKEALYDVFKDDRLTEEENREMSNKLSELRDLLIRGQIKEKEHPGWFKEYEEREKKKWEKYEIERKDFMENREFGQILTAFEGEEDCPISEFILELADELQNEDLPKEIEYFEKITEGNEKGLHLSDILNDYGTSIGDIAFEVGYVFRELFGISENQKSTKAAIEKIKSRIIKRGLLPFYPAEREPSINPTNK
jgi:hypothetical protein